MIRAATVTDVTPEGVWVVSSWLSGRTGPLFAVGLPAVGDAVLVVRTDDDALVVVAGGLPNGSVTSTDNAVARFDGEDGALQNSGVTIDDDDRLTTGNLRAQRAGAVAVEVVSDGNPYLTLDGGTDAYLNVRRSGVLRWSWVALSDDLALRRYNDSGVEQGQALRVIRATGRVRIGAPAAGIEFGTSGPLDMAGSGSPEGVVSAPVGSTWRRTDGGSGTTFYLKESGAGNTGWAAVQPGLPTVHTTWSLTSWSAGTVTTLNRTSTDTGLSSANYGDHFYDFQSNYFRVTSAGLYLISGVAGWSWSGDTNAFPMSGVFAATAGQYIDLRFWLSSPSGGSAASRGFCTPYVSGVSQSHCRGSSYLPSAIGSSPTEIWAAVGITRLGNAY